MVKEQNSAVFLLKIFRNDLFKTVVVLFILCVGIGVARPSTFLTINNFMKILSQTSVNGAIVVGMTFILLTGGIDLSVGSVAAVSSLLTALCLAQEMNVVVSLAVGLLSAICIGAATGTIVCKINLPPFIVTLAMVTIFRGATMVISQGQPVTDLGDAFAFIGVGYIGPIPVNVLLMLLFFGMAYYVLKHTRFGRHVYAVGGNKEATRLSGVNTNRIIIAVYAISAFFASFAGMIMAARVNSATPTAAEGYELDAIAAAVIGGVSLTGGRGNIVGAFIGALIIGVLNNGLVLLGIDVFWTKIVKGMIILLAVVIDALSKKRGHA